jgi:hypothetical protein
MSASGGSFVHGVADADAEHDQRLGVGGRVHQATQIELMDHARRSGPADGATQVRRRRSRGELRGRARGPDRVQVADDGAAAGSHRLQHVGQLQRQEGAGLQRADQRERGEHRKDRGDGHQ